MFLPKYEYTNTIISNTNTIERLYGQLESIHIPKNLMLNLQNENIITSTYSSNKIEGNPLTHLEVTNLLLGERVPVNRAEKEITNYFDILKSINKSIDKEINIQLMLEFHNKLLTGINDEIKGKIRNVEVVVGRFDENSQLIARHIPPFSTRDKISETLNDLFSWVNTENDIVKVLKIGIFHHQFEYIHPFEDGNGRIGRLLSSLLFLKYNYAINKYFILDDYYDIDKIEYSNKLHSADFGDETKWLEYFTNGIIYSLQSSIDKLNKGLSKLSISLRPTKKEEEVLHLIQKYHEITSQNISSEMGISRQQAFNLLKSLTEKGYIERRNKSKNTYYVLL